MPKSPALRAEWRSDRAWHVSWLGAPRHPHEPELGGLHVAEPLRMTTTRLSASVFSRWALSVAASLALLVACTSPGEDAEANAGAASEDEAEATPEQAPNFAALALFGGKSLRAFDVKSSAGAAADITRLWMSADGAFSVLPAATPTPGNGVFDATATTIKLDLTNRGEDAVKSSLEGDWTYQAKSASEIELSRAGQTLLLKAVE